MKILILIIQIYSSCIYTDSSTFESSVIVKDKYSAIHYLFNNNLIGQQSGGCINYLNNAYILEVNTENQEFSKQSINREILKSVLYSKVK